ncbi:hypothetical protein WOLCODRAFT_29714 [Wolfiporia cocos MD-104 SS10]|uniref:Uncharacterized protein n=1 Tax=Wolfiporia cocos (strain MD-104) TaxID=742152 RepID=A0A2H3JTK2_WOLCO|nr:hypothetical protein WOLCODRAFT_29567 [Wolfiporia cocos MD-104 SS10]PCH43341.1 hypothetical protein WOLCODRAFT_29714 [Wolfiporia cocos MD-104 SS10]
MSRYQSALLSPSTPSSTDQERILIPSDCQRTEISDTWVKWSPDTLIPVYRFHTSPSVPST